MTRRLGLRRRQAGRPCSGALACTTAQRSAALRLRHRLQLFQVGITDLDAREILIFAPLIIGTLVLGVYPNLIFNLTASSVDGLVGAWRAAVGG